ncbi:hypothetical protein LINPERHAP1_LOCUS19791, partial [Linum perenne]
CSLSSLSFPGNSSSSSINIVDLDFNLFFGVCSGGGGGVELDFNQLLNKIIHNIQ